MKTFCIMNYEVYVDGNKQLLVKVIYWLIFFSQLI
jgi:hypothetical protein